MSESLPVWGRVARLELPPTCFRYSDSIFVPPSFDKPWGLFTARGEQIRVGATFHGPSYHQVLPGPGTALIDCVAAVLDSEEHYFYCGVIHGHFGHCLLSTFSRFWPWLKTVKQGVKIILHGPHPFNLPFLKFWLQSLGFQEGDFIRLTETTKISNVIVPESAFEEQWAAHEKFAKLCLAVAHNNGLSKTPRLKEPIYLSKSHLKSGVQFIENEYEVEEILKQHSVRIAFPEELNPIEQVKLFWEHRLILGSASSAMHNVLFAHPKTRLAVYTLMGSIHGNFALIDMLRRRSSTYLKSETDSGRRDEKFSTTFRLRSPKETAAMLLAGSQIQRSN